MALGKDFSRPQTKLGLVLLSAFMLIGLATCVLAYTIFQSKFTSEFESQTLAEVKIVSQGISGDAHRELVTKNERTNPEYRKLGRQLESIRAQLSDVQALFTIRRSGREIFYVLNPTFAGDADSDVYLRTARLGEPVHNSTAAMRAAYDREVADVESSLEYGPRGRPYVSAYAPILDGHGRMSGLLVLHRDASGLQSQLGEARHSLYAAAGLVAFLAAVFSGVITRRIDNSARATWWVKALHSAVPYLRATILELLLVGLAAVVIAVGVAGYYSQEEAVTENLKSLSKCEKLDGIKGGIESQFGSDADVNYINHLINVATQIGEPSLVSLLTEAKNNHGVDRIRYLRFAITRADEVLQQQRVLQRFYQETLETRGRGLATSFVIASLLALGSLVLVRHAVGQERHLDFAKKDAQRQKWAYKQVAEKVPVGLYTFFEGKFDFANKTLNDQVGRSKGESIEEALERMLSDLEGLQLKRLLSESELKRQPYQFSFKIDEPEVRFYETQGVPIFDGDGGFEHLMGFVVDVTDRQIAQTSLESKHKEISLTNARLAKAFADLELNFEAMVHSLVKAVEAKNPYTAGHSERVKSYCVRIGQSLGLPEEKLRVLEMGALIHDIGKIGVPDEILTKDTSLTDSELAIIRQHPIIGYKMVQEIPLFFECASIVLSHHERLDGGGYPDKLRGDEIPLEVRICSVADAFDAMTSDRSYQRGLNASIAIDALRKDVEKGYLDGKIVEILADIVSRDGVLFNLNVEEAA